MAGNTARRASATEPRKAIGYMRTSSATNVGADKDSDKRQRQAIQAFADRAGFEVVAWYYDAAVSGADPIDTRPGFAEALERIAGNGVRTIIVETANRFARDLIVQETGFRMLQQRGIDLIAADSPTSFVDDTPTAALIRQVLGAVAQFEKAALVAKLRGARDRKRRDWGKCEGRKALTETNPDALKLAKRLRRANPITGKRMSFRDIAEKLAEAGHKSASGKPLSPSVVKRLLGA